MPKKYDVVAKVGETRDGKAIWKNAGAIMTNDRGEYLVMDATFNLAGMPNKNGSVLLSLFEPKQKSGGGLFPDDGPQQAPNYDNDEIPF